MEILFNTSNQIEATDAMEAEARDQVGRALARFESQLTRVELHLSDENSPRKGGAQDIRCALEARPEGLRPIAVTHDGADPKEAVRGAAQKLARALASEFGKLDQRR